MNLKKGNYYLRGNAIMSMSQRLRQARIMAGYRTASEAITKFRWNSSAYRAHENGQNCFSIHSANNYAKAYNTTSAWLMLGLESNHPIEDCSKNRPNESINSTNGWILEKIYAISVLLRDNQTNYNLAVELIENAKSYERLITLEINSQDHISKNNNKAISRISKN